MEQWLAQVVPDADERVRGRLARKIGPEFGAKFGSVVRGLANDGDLPTLLYLQWQIERAVAEIRQRTDTEPSH